MKFTLDDIKKMFPDFEKQNYYSFDYEPVDQALGERVVIVRDSDYQGQTRILYRSPEGLFAIDQYSWGSCSGCDFAQACSSYEEMLEYANGRWDALKWTNVKELEQKLNDMEAKAKDWAYTDQEELQFIEECREFIEGSHI